MDGVGPACNCRRWFCLLDSALHRVGIHWRWVCDRHDAFIITASDPCPWCESAPFGHDCETRDHYLEIEDSEMDR